MTEQKLSKIIERLIYTIEYQRCRGVCDSKIRVRIGRELLAWMIRMSGVRLSNVDIKKNEENDTLDGNIMTIYGYPMEIDNERSMCLEVLVVEDISDCEEG